MNWLRGYLEVETISNDPRISDPRFEALSFESARTGCASTPQESGARPPPKEGSSLHASPAEGAQEGGHQLPRGQEEAGRHPDGEEDLGHGGVGQDLARAGWSGWYTISYYNILRINYSIL